MTSKKRQKLTFCLEVVSKDFFGIFTVETLINGKEYTFCLNSEYILRKIESLIHRHKSGKALNLIKKWNVKEAL